jgi:hypothetical protein
MRSKAIEENIRASTCGYDKAARRAAYDVEHVERNITRIARFCSKPAISHARAG